MQLKKIDGRESNTAKGVSIATEFNECKDVFFNKNVIRHKMKRIQAKKHKIGSDLWNWQNIIIMFDAKRYVLDDGIHTLGYFHKDCNKKHGK